MRKHMTRVYDEILANQHESIYIGEDVEHGGYYLGIPLYFLLRLLLYSLYITSS